MLYEFTNKEQDAIVNAFRAGNWCQIRDLPNHIAPNNVLQQLQIKMKQELAYSSVISANKKPHLEHLKNNGGYFQKFEWMQDEYWRKHEQDIQDMIAQKIAETAEHPLPFNANQNKKLLKYEYPFNDKNSDKFVYGFLCIGDPYEATKDERLRAKWIEEAKLLYGEFKPAGP